MQKIYRRALFLLPLLLGLSLGIGTARGEAVLEAPGKLDLAYMAQQEAKIDDLAARQLGRRLQHTTADLSLLQTLLDRQLISDDDEMGLQAMGIVMGNLLASQYGLNWVIYTDKRGRSRALQIGPDQQVLFPSTMISRRVQAGADVDVKALYDKAGATVSRVRAQGLKPY